MFDSILFPSRVGFPRAMIKGRKNPFFYRIESSLPEMDDRIFVVHRLSTPPSD